MSSEEFPVECETLETVSTEESIPSLSHVINKALQTNKLLGPLQVENISCAKERNNCVGSASASILHKIIMEYIILTEQCGLKVDAVVSDGAAWNRLMWNIFGVTEECVSI